MAGRRHRQENVWDYPRPPRLERVDVEVRIEHAGVVVAEANACHRVLETSHPPVYYLAPDDVMTGVLRESSQRGTACEWKGRAAYFDLVVPGAPTVVAAACWSYPRPTPAFAAIADALAFYASRVDACFVDGERVLAQEGDFYGGWITSWIDGGRRGFKGGAGTWGW